MEIGQSQEAVIITREFWNETGISLVAGQEFEFRAEGEWTDWAITCDADGYTSANFAQKLTEFLRRMPNERWFTLIGSLGRDVGSFFRIGRGTTYSPPSSAPLLCFANDVRLAYANNQGEVRLIVTRIR